MAGGGQPTPQPPPPPTEEVVKQPTPIGQVVKTSHATNPIMGNNKLSYSTILKASLGAAYNLEVEDNNSSQTLIPTSELKPTTTKDGNPAVVFKALDKAKYLVNMKATLALNCKLHRHPLKIDHNNVNRVKLGQASVCVALDVSQPIRKKVWIGFEEEDKGAMVAGFWQVIQYDPYPYFCTDCCHLGHKMDECKRKKEQAGEGTIVATANFKGNVQGQETKEAQEKHIQSKTTKEWVQKLFGTTILATATTTKNTFAILDEAEAKNGQETQTEKRVHPSNILDASSLAPPSMLTGFGLQPVQLSSCLVGHSLPLKNKSAPPSPTAKRKEDADLLGDHMDLGKEIQDIMLKEVSLPFNE
ncbi:hypothetical protein LIER_20009 [Lithospermum erythrorhizon]|uniref:DUF4283 domain-containing protein n=1 Tax=Lithospermum erythrorhizon TaxID=34254 RepID=A0AAV3QMF3_LITER